MEQFRRDLRKEVHRLRNLCGPPLSHLQTRATRLKTDCFGGWEEKKNELFINFIFRNSLKLFLFLLYKDSCCWNETQWTTYLSTINKFNSCFTKEKIYKVALIKWTNEIWCVQAKAVILLGLKWFTVNDGVTTTEVGHGAGVEFIVCKKKKGLLVFIESF